MSTSSLPDWRRTMLSGAVIVAAFVLFACLSWRCWPDVLVDFGEELYLPWRLTEGEVLYRDLAFVGGPLSLFFHAFLFRLFGVSLTTLIAANLSVLALITAMLWWIFRRCGTCWSATIVTFFFLAVFAFGQYGLIANYNYVCPYRHEVTHGLALGLANLVCLIRFRETRRTYWLLAGGWFLGLVVLTKVEMTLAAILATVAALVIVARAGCQPGTAPGAGDPAAPGSSRPLPTGLPRYRLTGSRRLLCDLAATALPLAAVAVAPLGVAVAALSRSLGWTAACQGVLATYRLALFPAGSAQSAFYKAAGGWDDPAANLATMIVFAAIVASVVIGAFLVERILRQSKWSRGWGVLLGVAAWWSATQFVPANEVSAGSLSFDWFDLPRAFPLLLTGVTIALLGREWRRPSPEAFPLCLAAVFALGLLPKIALRAGWSHYGFVLTMPAALVLAHVAVVSLPNWVAQKSKSAECYRGLLLGLLAACILVRLLNWMTIYRYKTQPVVAGPDCFYVDPEPTHDERSGPTVRALAFLQKNMREDETLVVFPNGTMLNYLLRKRNPTPYQIFSPFEFDVFGDEAVTGDVIRAAPDWVVLVTMDMSVFGRGEFGSPQYAAQIRRFLDEAYEIAAREATPAGATREFSATVFHRRSPRD